MTEQPAQQTLWKSLSRVAASVALGALVLGLLAKPASAIPTMTFDPFSAVGAPTGQLSFEGSGLLPNATVTTQFSSSGVTFTDIGGAGSPRLDGCGYGQWNNFVPGMFGSTLGTYGPGCQTNATNDDFSINFAQSIDALSMQLGFYGPVSFTILLAGSQVGHWDWNTSGQWTYVNFLGATFDQLVINESPTQEAYTIIDNMAWSAAAPAPVPVPGALALLGIGLCGIGILGRSRKGG